jgi:hypothetical protein
MKEDKNSLKPDALKRDRPKSYNSPKLINFGTVANLTQQNGNGPDSDAGNNMMAAS